MKIELPIEELRKRKIFLATPMYGGQCSGMYARSVMDLASYCLHYGVTLRTHFLFNESLITRARNYCVDEFMRSDCTHLMFIDSDIGFNPQDVLTLLALSGEDTEYDVVGAPYPKKCIAWEKIKVAVDKGFAEESAENLSNFVGDFVFNPKGTNEIKLLEPAEVLEIGTGFMMIKKSVFEKYKTAYPHMSYKPDHVRTEQFDGSREIFSFFDCIIDRGYDLGDLQNLITKFKNKELSETEFLTVYDTLKKNEETSSKRYLSEDYMFCQNVQKMGNKVWLCPWMKLQHVGTYVFGGSLVDMAQLGVSATADVNMLRKPKGEQLKQLPPPKRGKRR